MKKFLVLLLFILIIIIISEIGFLYSLFKKTQPNKAAKIISNNSKSVDYELPSEPLTVPTNDNTTITYVYARTKEQTKDQIQIETGSGQVILIKISSTTRFIQRIKGKDVLFSGQFPIYNNHYYIFEWDKDTKPIKPVFRVTQIISL